MPVDKLRREVAKRVKKWRRVLGLGPDWRIGVRVLESPEDPGADANDAVAYIRVEPGYFQAAMTVNAWHVDKATDLDQVIAHELTHIILQPVCTIVEAALGEHMAEVANQNMEALCERVSRALVRLDRA
jgi:hypothetical protein